MLLKSSLQPSSIPTYKRAWRLFAQFLHTVFNHTLFTLPISPSVLALFVAYMFDSNYAPSTVNTYVSALGYSHKLMGFSDPTKVFYVSQMLKGYGKIGFRLDSRLPITLPILQKVISNAPGLPGSHYSVCQFQAMCTLAFFGFLHIGHITASPTPDSPSPLQLCHLTKLLDSQGTTQAFRITFCNFKHHYNKHPFSLVISRQQVCCPVQLLSAYLSFWGDSPGPLFRALDGSPVARTQFASQLSLAISLCGLDPSRYKGHSFRIGTASHAADRGFSDAQIRLLGRWKSNAFHKYICTPSLSSWYFLEGLMVSKGSHISLLWGGALWLAGAAIALLFYILLGP